MTQNKRADPWISGLIVFGALVVFVCGVIFGAAFVAPRQAQNRAEIYGTTADTLRVPTREITLTQARHACQQAQISLRAVVERLREPRVIHHYKEERDE